MKSINKLLLRQFITCYDADSWFVAVRNAVDGLTAAQAAWWPMAGQHSIWQTLEHLTFYNYAYFVRFRGEEYEYPTADNDETFTAGGTEEEWNQAVERFDAVMTNFRELIAAADDSRLAEQVSAENTRSWAELISDINAHNAYHAGQILLVRKLQGSWNPNKGVS
ncbi:MAG: DinB family protein [Chloracidobacterium sp.]|nr:DinB family protein [Chloracidobacterium sp.]